jgi:hypothetical protein
MKRDYLAWLEWARLQAIERGQTADRVVPPEPDLTQAITRSLEHQAWESMEHLNAIWVKHRSAP